ncbi:LapA family protein [uncultured Psychroserpens sp.]|uniref:LapA family protein n=1 Tax=uncultured Psychroserpens sp. TaxID=255436 RepID=UPI00260626FD|nr:LapA family protein [uncultured Psychroserpens sp.]
MKDKNTNYFVRTLIILLCIGISSIIAFKFFFTEPKGEISGGLITLIIFLLVLALAESFDSFSVGKLLSIKREIQKKEKENQKLERKNEELLSQIFNISNNQKQSTTSVFGDYYSGKKKGNQNKDIDENVVQELLDAIGNSVVITEMENNIKKELDNKNLPYDTPTDTILIRHLAGTQLALNFETIHSAIFGSQIILLKDLNRVAPDGMTTTEISNYIAGVFKQFSGSFTDWDDEKYLSYLYSSTLITKTENQNIHLTNKGVDYLSWIVRNGKREDFSF